MALSDFCNDIVIIDDVTYDKEPNTKIPKIISTTNIGTFRSQTQVTGSKEVSLEEDNQEGQIDIWGCVLLQDDLDATNFDPEVCERYRITLPNGAFGKIIEYDANTSPSEVIEKSVILTVEQAKAT